MAASMLMRGTTKHTRQQIQDEFDRLKARVSVGGGATAVDGAASRRRARTCRRCSTLMAEVLREPAFPPSEFEQLQAGERWRRSRAEERAAGCRGRPPSRAT